MDASDLADFNASRLDTQFALYARPGTFRGAPIACCPTGAAKSRVFTEAGGKVISCRVILRIRREDIHPAPELDERFTWEGEELVIVGVDALTNAGEWRIALDRVGA